jgi:phospholipase C
VHWTYKNWEVANKNAIPGPNFRKAQQLAASDQGGQDSFLLSPPKQEFPSNQLPAPQVGAVDRQQVRAV